MLEAIEFLFFSSRHHVPHDDDSNRKSVFRVLVAMTNLGEPCNDAEKLVEYYLTSKGLYAQMQAETPEDKRLSKVKSMVDYFDWSAKHGKFNLCLRQFREEIEKVELAASNNCEVVGNLDKLIYKGYGNVSKHNQYSMLEAAKKFDFADRNLRFMNLVMSLRQIF